MSVWFCLLQVKKYHLTSAQTTLVLKLWLVKSLVQRTVSSASGRRGPHAPTPAPLKMLRAAKAGVGPSWPFQPRVSGKHFWINHCLVV